MLQKIETQFTASEKRSENPVSRTKFNISMEKKIERLFFESADQGWNYNHFVSNVLEVLTVLQLRNQLHEIDFPSKKLARRRRALNALS